MRPLRWLPLTLVGLAAAAACVDGCGGQVASIADAGPGPSSSSGATGSSGAASSSGVGSSGVGSSGASGSSGATTQDSGFGSSSGVIDATSGDTSAACTQMIPILDPDGGMNVPCESCLATSCGAQDCTCVMDPNAVPIDDAGDVAPGCDLFVNCVYADYSSIRAGDPDAGAASGLMTAIADCSNGGPFTQSSEDEGTAFIQCLATSCAPECLP